MWNDKGTEPGHPMVNYTYDDQGRMSSREELSPDGENDAVTDYVYDGTDLIGEIDAATGKLTKSYTWLPGAGTDGSDLLSAITTYDASGNVSAVYRPFYNGHDDVMGLENQSGQVVATYSYSAYGVRTAFGPAANVCNFAFDNYYEDPKTGLDVAEIRIYNPVLGIFDQRDPSGEANGGPNLYAYGHRDPINNTDPTGEAGHHIVPQALYEEAATAVKTVFNSAVARMEQMRWIHGGGSVSLLDDTGQVVRAVSHVAYNKAVQAEAQKLFGKSVKDLSEGEAKVFLQHIQALSRDPQTDIGLYNTGMQKAMGLGGRTSEVTLTSEELASGRYTPVFQTGDAAAAAEITAEQVGGDEAAESTLGRLVVPAIAVDVLGVALTIFTITRNAGGDNVQLPYRAGNYPVAPPGWENEKVPVVTQSWVYSVHFNAFGHGTDANIENQSTGGQVQWIARKFVGQVMEGAAFETTRGFFGYDTNQAEKQYLIAPGYRIPTEWDNANEEDRAAAWQAYRDSSR